jgi:transcriptional regulator with XRE-family HTH domain
MFPNLKLQIFRRGGHQNQLAKAVGIDETVLSKIIHGYRAPSAAQRRILASYLEVDEAWLFERFEATSLFAKAAKQPPDENKAPHNGDV